MNHDLNQSGLDCGLVTHTPRRRSFASNSGLRWVPLISVALALGLHAQAAVEFQRLKSFGFPDQRGQFPVTPVLLASDGALYGTTPAGGPLGGGTVFKVNPDGSGFTVLQSLGPGSAPGRPQSGLLEASDGALYGMTSAGGSHGEGTVFKLKKDGSGYAVLHHFGEFEGDGEWGSGELVEGDDGHLYGTTYSGGDDRIGTVFRIGKDGSDYAILHSFEGRVGGPDGFGPRAGLIKGNDGALYGTTAQGGLPGGGTVFKLNQDGGGYAVLYSFGSIPDDGCNPNARLEAGSDGYLYGTTADGGAGPVGNFGLGNGAVFKIAEDGSGYSVLHRFQEKADGVRPLGGVIEGADGWLYGTASEGGEAIRGGGNHRRSRGTPWQATDR
jgi:uncharacterized repeat protein (TIGR03803 family)